VTITAIERQKRDNTRFSVFIDGVFRLGLSGEEIANNKLAVGDNIGEDALAALSGAAEYGKAKNAALNYLGARARSRKEVYDKLTEKGFGDDAARRAAAGLEDCGIINDAEYARLYIESVSKRYGAARIKETLKRRGVSESDISAAFAGTERGGEAVPEIDAAEAAVLKRFGGIPEDFAERRRALGFLARRGFSRETISRVLSGAEEG
jgi:regulatory protein